MSVTVKRKYLKRTNSELGFAMIEKEIMQSIAWKKLNGGAVKLYVYMRSVVMRKLRDAVKLNLNLSYETMMKETGLSRQTVQFNIIKLENAGFIDFVKQGGLKGGGLSSNGYAISQRFLKFDSPLFQKGVLKKQHGYADRGFSKYWAGKKQRAGMKIIPVVHENHTGNKKIN